MSRKRRTKFIANPSVGKYTGMIKNEWNGRRHQPVSLPKLAPIFPVSAPNVKPDPSVLVFDSFADTVFQTSTIKSEVLQGEKIEGVWIDEKPSAVDWEKLKEKLTSDHLKELVKRMMGDWSVEPHNVKSDKDSIFHVHWHRYFCGVEGCPFHRSTSLSDCKYSLPVSDYMELTSGRHRVFIPPYPDFERRMGLEIYVCDNCKATIEDRRVGFIWDFLLGKFNAQNEYKIIEFAWEILRVEVKWKEKEEREIPHFDWPKGTVTSGSKVSVPSGMEQPVNIWGLAGTVKLSGSISFRSDSTV